MQSDTAGAIIAYKAFNADFTCRGHQFEVGGTYEITGAIVPCKNGFHACEHPLDVFSYYPAAWSRFAEVRCEGDIKREGDKIACAKITVVAEIALGDLIQRAVKRVMEAADWTRKQVAKAEREGCSATSYSGAASATGDSGAASATGTRGAASATGTRGAASATGDSGAASATGACGAASATGTCGAPGAIKQLS